MLELIPTDNLEQIETEAALTNNAEALELVQSELSRRAIQIYSYGEYELGE